MTIDIMLKIIGDKIDELTKQINDINNASLDRDVKRKSMGIRMAQSRVLQEVYEEYKKDLLGNE